MNRTHCSEQINGGRRRLSVSNVHIQRHTGALSSLAPIHSHLSANKEDPPLSLLCQSRGRTLHMFKIKTRIYEPVYYRHPNSPGSSGSLQHIESGSLTPANEIQSPGIWCEQERKLESDCARVCVCVCVCVTINAARVTAKRL